MFPKQGLRDLSYAPVDTRLLKVTACRMVVIGCAFRLLRCPVVFFLFLAPLPLSSWSFVRARRALLGVPAGWLPRPVVCLCPPLLLPTGTPCSPRSLACCLLPPVLTCRVLALGPLRDGYFHSCSASFSSSASSSVRFLVACCPQRPNLGPFSFVLESQIYSSRRGKAMAPTKTFTVAWDPGP